MSIKRADLGKITSVIKSVKINYIDSNENPTADIKNIGQDNEAVSDIELILNLPKPKSIYDIALDEGFVGTQAEFISTMSLAEEEKENVVSLYVGKYEHKENFSAARADFNGTQPYGYDFGNGLICETLNSKNVTLVYNSSYSLIDNDTGSTVWLSSFLSNGNSGPFLKLSLPKASKITLRMSSFSGIREFTANYANTLNFLPLNEGESTTAYIPNDGKIYTVTIEDTNDEAHDLILSVAGGGGMRIYEIKWESLNTINFQLAFSKFKNFYKNILSLEGGIEKPNEFFESFATAADEQLYTFMLDLQKTINLNMWDIAESEKGIINKNLKNCKNLQGIITPKGHIIYNN